jgi:hypothetical protein
VGVSLFNPLLPRPEAPEPGVFASRASRGPFVEGGAPGVPLAVGVPRGVLFVLSTRDFRKPDLGVILLLMKVDTGVVKSFRDEPTGVVSSGRAFRCDNGVLAGDDDPATLGVNGVLLLLFAALAEALRVGASGVRVVAAAAALFLS